MEIRKYAYWVMAAAAQHNPKVQDVLIRHGALPKALEALQSDPEVEVRQKGALVISAIVKQCHAGFIEFTRLDGFAILAGILAGPGDQGIQQRLAFFFGQLLEERPRLATQYKNLFDRVQQINDHQ